MVFIAQVSGVHKDGGGKESGDAGRPLQRDVAQWTLKWAEPNWEPVRGQGIPDLTVSLPGHVQGVIGVVLECGGESGCGLGVNNAVSPQPSHKLW